MKKSKKIISNIFFNLFVSLLVWASYNTFGLIATGILTGYLREDWKILSTSQIYGYIAVFTLFMLFWISLSVFIGMKKLKTDCLPVEALFMLIFQSILVFIFICISNNLTRYVFLAVNWTIGYLMELCFHADYNTVFYPLEQSVSEYYYTETINGITMFIPHIFMIIGMCAGKLKSKYHKTAVENQGTVL